MESTFLARWIPHLADIKRPLCQLLRDDVEWQWSNEHRKAVQLIKSLLTAAPVFQFFQPGKQAFIQCLASSRGLGAMLLENDQPIAFAFRALTDAESRQAQIEKELLVIVFTAEKFEHYIYGADKTIVFSDHRNTSSKHDVAEVEHHSIPTGSRLQGRQDHAGVQRAVTSVSAIYADNT
jgi:hypothetical protein